MPPPVLNYTHGAQPVYGLLVRIGDGEFTFREISDRQHQPAEGYLVRLNDFSPAFDT